MDKNNLKIIAGSSGGGGGGSQRSAQEAPDSLRSRQFARVLDLISEGEIEGIVDGLKGVFFNETPIENFDGSFNFSNFASGNTTGTQTQDYIPGFTEIENEIAVNSEVKNSQPIIRGITNTILDAVRVTIGIPQLTNQNLTTGDLNGSAVNIAIDLQSNGGGFVGQIVNLISGKTTTRYQRSYRIELNGSPPWDIRVRRKTVDNELSNIRNDIFWDSYTELIDSKLNYPNSAIVGAQIDAEQFSAIPRRAYLVKGIRVRIPINYDPETRFYDNDWNGDFKIAWTDNPAWCFYDLVTEKRYGLGDFLSDTQVDIWALYTIGQYCDQLIDDGFGGTEPRFTCNLYLQTRAEAYTVLTNMAAIFRSILFWSGGTLLASQDSPQDPLHLFTPANVIDGLFTYSGTAKDTRHTVALVSWNDPDDFYRQKIEYVEDIAAIELYGINKTNIVAFGCTSRGQAHRFGKWLLLTENAETDVVSFKVGLDGAFVTPGRIINVQDPARAGKRFGGRIKSATTTQIEIDSEVEIEALKNYTLTCAFRDVDNNDVLETQDVTNSAETTTTINTDAFSEAPQVQGIWVLAEDDLVPQQFKIISIAETGKAELSIVALKYNPGKYAAIEDGIILEPLPIGSPPKILEPPFNLVIGEYMANHQGKLKIVMTVTWEAVPDAIFFNVKYKRLNENYIVLPETTDRFIEVFDAEPGTYQVSVTARSNDNIVSLEAIAVNAILGSETVSFMPDVTGLKLFPEINPLDILEFTGNEPKFVWDEVRIDGLPQSSIFESYEVRVFNGINELLRTEQLTDNTYVYTYEKNVEDTFVPTPDLPTRIPVVVTPFPSQAGGQTFVGSIALS